MSRSALRHGVVILAAGASSRLGTSKQTLLVNGQPLIRIVTCAALATDPVRTVVVLGANASDTFGAIADLPVHRVDCEDWAAGMGASVRAGVRPIQSTCDGILVLLCDQPALTVCHLQRLVAAWLATPTNAIASAYARTLGAPALFPRSWFADLLQIDGDRGARDLLRGRTDGVIGIPAPELSIDIDTPTDIRAAGLERN